ncbi:hypothetical protein [Tenacibaculum agarivorans]|uniref:hypothetical protein n=1 Tax=Tenacibaculum agarivorans TaxID=1908389 RepID=UPI00094B9C70|nr:hypothetical protein [Tenacibaculum agarivorans]
MRKRIILSLVCLIFIGLQKIKAQYVQWAFNTESGNSKVFGMDMDADGNTYTTGHYYSGIQLSKRHSNVGFYIAKYDTDGNAVWSHVAGAGNTRGLAIAVDNNGNSFVAGYFQTDITFGEGPTQVTLTTTQNFPAGFIAKYDSNGVFLWAQKIPGDQNNEEIREIEVDQSGDCYVLGTANGNNYLAKHSGVDGSVIWSRNDTGAQDISTDGTNLYFTGTFRGTKMLDGNTITSSERFKTNIFYGKMNGGGSIISLLSSGGINTSDAVRISSDTSGNVYILGSRFREESSFGGNPLTYKDFNNIFIAKFGASGNQLWARQADGVGNPGPAARDIVADEYGVYITGYFHTTLDFGSVVVKGKNAFSILFKSYVAKYDINGSNQWVKVSGGVSFDEPYRVATNGKGKVTISGRTGAKATYECVELDYASQSYWGYNVRYHDATHPLAGSLPANAAQKPAPANPISGDTVVCAGQSGVIYTTDPITQGNVIYYKWELPAGATIISGKDTNSITVDFSGSATSGIIKVSGVSLSCESEPAELALQVKNIPSNSGMVKGLTQVVSGQTNVTYTLEGVSDADQYQWTLPSGITSSSGTTTTTSNSIQLNFPNASGQGTLQVKGVNSCGESNVYALDITYQAFSISGNIINEKGNAISDVNLVLTTGTDKQEQLTSTGTYQFLSLSREDYILKPERNDADLDPTVGFFDYVTLLQYNAGFATLNAYKTIAADLNNDNKVTNDDLNLLQNILNDVTTPIITWRFVPENYMFTDTNLPFTSGIAFPEELQYTPLNGEKVDQNFIAIPVGKLVN